MFLGMTVLRQQARDGRGRVVRRPESFIQLPPPDGSALHQHLEVLLVRFEPSFPLLLFDGDDGAAARRLAAAALSFSSRRSRANSCLFRETKLCIAAPEPMLSFCFAKRGSAYSGARSSGSRLQPSRLHPAVLVATWQRRGASLRFVSANARSTGNDEMALASKAVASAFWTGSEQSQLTMC